MSRKSKRRPKAFSYRLLVLSVLLGITLGATVLFIALLSRGYKVDWQSLLISVTGSIGAGIGINQQNKPTKKDDDNSDPKPEPLPVKPKPFNPPPFESVREVEKGEYVKMAKELLNKHEARQVERLSMKQLLELNHDDKPKVAKPRAANSSNVDLPLYAPYQILALLNGDTATAMRLYKGIAERYQGKSEQWVWGKVESDLTRDRH